MISFNENTENNISNSVLRTNEVFENENINELENEFEEMDINEYLSDEIIDPVPIRFLPDLNHEFENDDWNLPSPWIVIYVNIFLMK